MSITVRPTTAGNMGFWNGTKDDLEGYIDYATGESNINSPQEINITVENIRILDEKPSFAKNGRSKALQAIASILSPYRFRNAEHSLFPECRRAPCRKYP